MIGRRSALIALAWLTLWGTAISAREAPMADPPMLAACGAQAAPCRATTPSAEVVETAAKGHLVAVWFAEGVLYLAVRDLPGPVTLCCRLSGRLAPVSGSPYQALALRLPAGDTGPYDLILQTGGRDLLRQTWSGKPPLMALRAGRLEDHRLSGAGLTRQITVYAPQGVREDSAARVVYLADGQGVAAYAAAIDPLIATGALPKTLIVGLWNAPEARDLEYLPGRDRASFEAHERFLLEAVVPFVEARYEAPKEPARRLLAGASSGATWAIATSGRHPDAFPNVLALAPVWGPVVGFVKTAPPTRLFVGVGTEDAAALKIAAAIEAAGPKNPALCVEQGLGGHQPEVWSGLFAAGLTWQTIHNQKCLRH